MHIVLVYSTYSTPHLALMYLFLYKISTKNKYCLCLFNLYKFRIISSSFTLITFFNAVTRGKGFDIHIEDEDACGTMAIALIGSRNCIYSIFALFSLFSVLILILIFLHNCWFIFFVLVCSCCILSCLLLYMCLSADSQFIIF